MEARAAVYESEQVFERLDRAAAEMFRTGRPDSYVGLRHDVESAASRRPLTPDEKFALAVSILSAGQHLRDPTDAEAAQSSLIEAASVDQSWWLPRLRLAELYWDLGRLKECLAACGTLPRFEVMDGFSPLDRFYVLQGEEFALSCRIRLFDPDLWEGELCRLAKHVGGYGIADVSLTDLGRTLDGFLAEHPRRSPRLVSCVRALAEADPTGHWDVRLYREPPREPRHAD